MIARGLVMLFLGLMAPVAGMPPALADVVRMGVRADAKPFVFRDDAGYTGFLYDICMAAVSASGHKVDLVEVTARDRFARLGAEEGGIDMLCDPTTITLARAGRWDFTQIVFIANATFAQRTQARPMPADRFEGCAAAAGEEILGAGWLRDTTSEGLLEAALDSGAIRPGRNRVVCGVAVDDHRAGIERFCSSDGDLSFYFGDGDILAAQIAAYEAQSGAACPAVFAARGFLTYEPYAIALSEARLPGLSQELRRNLYSVFRSPLVADSFTANFGEDRSPSEAVEALWRMYRIPEGAPQ
ncbi:transporter substrate-binding domain-containing protein [Tropicimonas sp. IMCC34043]|uniref:transporter substrate-binding domain-containing protein n=1 Tax=Tropicimonas sp. IMCC34043 TaxID=2248760 RepID=UPI000E224AD4|nr:transporter substrate-binding domain-containing protein [Tropicimonas sp. IMCC34043]